MLSEYEFLAKSAASGMSKLFRFKGRSRSQPLVKRLPLLQAPGEKGSVVVKFDVQLFQDKSSSSPKSPGRASSTTDDLALNHRTSTSQYDLSNRPKSSMGESLRQERSPKSDEQMKRRALSTVFPEDWDD